MQSLLLFLLLRGFNYVEDYWVFVYSRSLMTLTSQRPLAEHITLLKQCLISLICTCLLTAMTEINSIVHVCVCEIASLARENVVHIDTRLLLSSSPPLLSTPCLRVFYCLRTHVCIQQRRPNMDCFGCNTARMYCTVLAANTANKS